MADSPEKKKYEPLGEHLAAFQPAITELTLSFAEVEKIIGDTLPPSAFKHREWWSNQKGGSARLTGGRRDLRSIMPI